MAEPKCWDDLVAQGWERQERETSKGKKTVSFLTPQILGSGQRRSISKPHQLREYMSLVTILFPHSMEAREQLAATNQVINSKGIWLNTLYMFIVQEKNNLGEENIQDVVYDAASTQVFFS